MIEIILERWTAPDGATDHRWSLWRDGRRIEMGRAAYPDPDTAEQDARATCRQRLGRDPDQITRL